MTRTYIHNCIIVSGLLSLSTALSGCSSIMTRTGPTEGYYAGTKNSIAMLQDDETGWVMKPVIAIDLPLSAALDTLLAPVDYALEGKDNSLTSPAARVKQLEAAKTAQHQTDAQPVQD
ncbi:YceK/YidQ family lipoprotein [Morganella psychrotolerans]|uniref:YceK/YidQ family lipoprotein n=1 Tax=Morganella psychrotolerans TaxID=368603 RepID=UPI0039AF34EC